MTEPFVPRTQKGLLANAVGWIAAILAVSALVAGAVWGWRYVTAPAAGKVSARQQINSGAYRIAAYNHFFDVCAAVQTDESRLAAQRAELVGASPDDASRIRANIAGISSDRADAINEYNADAAKGYTLGQFRASGLPYRLDQTKEHTLCAS